jgi:hypothetical protein
MAGVIVRLAFIVLPIVWGYHAGGPWGAYTMFLVMGAVGGCLAAPKPAQARRMPATAIVDEGVPARRGRREDPTRPTTDDYAGLIVNDYMRRHKG